MEFVIAVEVVTAHVFDSWNDKIACEDAKPCGVCGKPAWYVEITFEMRM